MNLAIDVGNSSVKMAVVDGGRVVEGFRTSDPDDIRFAVAILDKYPAINAAIAVSVRSCPTALERYLSGRLPRYMVFDRSTPLPVGNLYATPDTLGYDRLAAAVGANSLYPDTNVLIVDFGTAITFDVVSEHNEFLGGNISPGAATRFRALHEYTAKLPLGNLREETSLIGRDSLDAVESGVVNGIVYEIEGYISSLEPRFAGLRIIFTGGDGKFFAKRLKKAIFATYDLVVYGLNRILEYNAD